MILSNCDSARVSNSSGITTTARAQPLLRQFSTCASQRSRMRGCRMVSSLLRAGGVSKNDMGKFLAIQLAIASNDIFAKGRPRFQQAQIHLVEPVVARFHPYLRLVQPAPGKNCAAVDLPMPTPPVRPQVFMVTAPTRRDRSAQDSWMRMDLRTEMDLHWCKSESSSRDWWIPG